jgi:FlaG/FlaF family flagellin (archaellin)
VDERKLPSRFNESIRAVSPVVGVILKVAIAVILAAVVATTVLTILPDAEPGPTASFEASEDPENGTVVFVHVGGDTIDADRLEVVGAGTINRTKLGDEVTAGERIRIERIVADEGDEIRLRWNDEKEQKAALMTERTLTAEHTGVDNPPSGTVTITTSDISPGDSEFDVETSEYENTTTAFLVVKNADTGDEVTYPNTGETTVTVDTAPLNIGDGDQIRAELYDTEDRVIELDNDTTTVSSGGGGGPGFTFTAVALAVVLAGWLNRRQDETEEGGDD